MPLPEFDLIFRALSAGGDAATVALFVLWLRLDRRLFRLEILFGLKKGKSNG